MRPHPLSRQQATRPPPTRSCFSPRSSMATGEPTRGQYVKRESADDPGAIRPPRRTANDPTRWSRRPSGLVGELGSLQTIWQKNFGQKDAAGSRRRDFCARILLPSALEEYSFGQAVRLRLRPRNRGVAEPGQSLAEKRRKGAAGRGHGVRGADRRRGNSERPSLQTALARLRPHAPRGHSRPRDRRRPDPIFSFFSALWFGRVASKE